MGRPKIQPARPFKQYIRKPIDITHDQEREIRLLQAALKDKNTVLTFSQIVGIMIDDFLGKLKKSDDKG